MLDQIYRASAWFAAAQIVGICLLVSIQVMLNISTRWLDLPVPPGIPSYTDISGFLLAGSMFFALPYTFRTGGHVRVSLITMRLPDTVRWGLELVVLAIVTALAGYAVWFFFKHVLDSATFGDVSSGTLSVPLWIPQMSMVIGGGLLVVSMIDAWIGTYRIRTPVIVELRGKQRV